MLLLMVAFFHCAWEWQAELGHAGSPAHDCGNESGCICRGATMAQPVDASGLDDSLVHCLELPAAAIAGEAAGSGDETLRPPRQNLVVRIFGRQLRAQYASLVI